MNNPIDISIVELLGEDGRMSNSEIARRLDVSEATVRQRLKRWRCNQAGTVPMVQIEPHLIRVHERGKRLNGIANVQPRRATPSAVDRRHTRQIDLRTLCHLEIQSIIPFVVG